MTASRQQWILDWIWYAHDLESRGYINEIPAESRRQDYVSLMSNPDCADFEFPDEVAQ
jgi:hypothetical protein